MGLDSAAIIKATGSTLYHHSHEFWTTPSVIKEIRDSRARMHLQTLPFELKVRVPDHLSMKRVIDFAKKTGDYSYLSYTDMEVIALLVMLEKEDKGNLEHLATEPKYKLDANHIKEYMNQQEQKRKQQMKLN